MSKPRNDWSPKNSFGLASTNKSVPGPNSASPASSRKFNATSEPSCRHSKFHHIVVSTSTPILLDPCHPLRITHTCSPLSMKIEMYSQKGHNTKTLVHSRYYYGLIAHGSVCKLNFKLVETAICPILRLILGYPNSAPYNSCSRS